MARACSYRFPRCIPNAARISELTSARFDDESAPSAQPGCGRQLPWFAQSTSAPGYARSYCAFSPPAVRVFAKVRGDVARWPSSFRALEVALERSAEVFFRDELCPFRMSRSACRVGADARPFPGGGKRTPARRAFDRPIAMACLVDRAPCLPSPMWSISSFTNSPAGVLGDFRSAASSRARSRVSSSGLVPPHLSAVRQYVWLPVNCMKMRYSRGVGGDGSGAAEFGARRSVLGQHR